MTPEANKAALTAAFADMATGDARAFVRLMADDFAWTARCEGPWKGTWAPKSAVRTELFGPLFAQFDGTYANTAERILADGDWAVVQCQGSVRTKAGPRYDNQYCYVIRFRDGLMVELIEYMDTALAERVLADPPARMS